MYFSELIKGTANHERDCYGETFRTDKYEWNNVLVQAKYKIQLSEADELLSVYLLPTISGVANIGPKRAIALVKF